VLAPMKTKIKFYIKISIIICAFCLASLIVDSRGLWTQKSNFIGSGRNSAIGFSIGNKGYVGTGCDNATLFSDFWEWDQSTDTWSQKASFLGTARYGASGFSIGTKGYIGIGLDRDSLRSDFWEWDQAINIWSQKAWFPEGARSFAASFVIGGQGYIATGGPPIRNDFWEYDQSTDIWIQKLNYPGPLKYEATGFSIGQKGYLILGAQANYGNYFNDFWEWDQSTDVWIQKADFPITGTHNSIGRTNPVSFTIGNKAFVGTGYYRWSTQNATLCDDLWEWDQSTDIWTEKENFKGTGRFKAIGFSIGSKGYIGTGSDYGNLQDFWEYCDTCLGIGVNEIDKSNSILLYPNPLTTHGTIQSKILLNDADIFVYNQTGLLVEKLNHVSSETLPINFTKLISGIYFVRIFQAGNLISSTKLVFIK